MRIFLAGATGAIGRRLVPQLLDAGHHVSGTTRSRAKSDALRSAGVDPIVVDVFDAPALLDAMRKVRPDVVIQQLTDLPPGLDPSRMAEGVRRNARIRSEGTRNVVGAATQSGAHRLIAQSIAWIYAPGPEPHKEEDAIDISAAGDRSITVGGVVTLERLVLSAGPLEGVVLRYGHLYGPGTGADGPGEPPSVHVDAAASAAVLAIENASPGIYNIAEMCGYLSADRAQRELGWEANFRLAVSR
jgi:nucleoside-diphosphate-sugar epimerase